MIDGENMPTYTHSFWAKAFPNRQRGPERIHLLEHHLADVGACLEALLAQPTIRRRLARAAGLDDPDDLDDATTARLAVFATLHDIGKVNVGFQTRIWREEDVGERRKPTGAGHTADLLPVLFGDDQETSEWFLDAMGWPDHISRWDSDDGLTACAMLIAALSHHGRPLNVCDTLPRNRRIWRRFGGLTPKDCVERIGELARDWFPAAFSASAPPLPSQPAFQHMFLGLCNLADWLGSNEDMFPFYAEQRADYIDTAREQAKRAVKAVGLDIADQRAAFLDVPRFGRLFDIEGASAPNAIQKKAFATPLEERLVIIESETGSGKTEAALWRFAHMYGRKLVDGLYFALPTRAAASQMHDRVNRFIKRMMPNEHAPEPVLAVPGYVRAGDLTGQHLHNYQVSWDDTPDLETSKRRWAAEGPKRFLAAQIAVGTVDQAMMAALQVSHSHLRAACLSRNLLIVDEVHASDPYMRVILEALLNTHVGAGSYALLMSATLGSAARRQWLLRPKQANSLPKQSLADAIATAYPAISTRADANSENVAGAGENDQKKSVWIDARSAMHEFVEVGGLALEAARSGAKILVVRNTVDYAVKTQRAIELAAETDDQGLLFRCNNRPTLHTGRFAADDRRLLDREVEKQLGKDRSGGGRIIVGTQTLEQSLDIDADLLVTDLCPMDVLLQRIGRLHRHDREDRPDGYREPHCIALLPPHDDLTPLLSKKGNGASRNGLGGFVYPDRRILELTRRLVESHSESGEPWRIPEMNRELVEGATHPDELERLVEEMGDEAGGGWKMHELEVEGATIANNLTAKDAVVRRDKTFLDSEVVFANIEEKIRTRLGDEGIEVEFHPSPPSPFDGHTKIPKLTIPEHWSRGLAVEGPVEPARTEGGFTFSVGQRHFTYDRLGLCRL